MFSNTQMTPEQTCAMFSNAKVAPEQARQCFRALCSVFKHPRGQSRPVHCFRAPKWLLSSHCAAPSSAQVDPKQASAVFSSAPVAPEQACQSLRAPK